MERLRPRVASANWPGVVSYPAGDGGGQVLSPEEIQNRIGASAQELRRGYPQFLSSTQPLVNRDWVVALTLQPMTLALPSYPATGWAVEIGRLGPQLLTVARGNSTILGQAQDFSIDVNGASVLFVHDGTTWRAFATGGWC